MRRKYVSSSSYKRGGAVKRPAAVRNIVKKPLLYGKTDPQDNKPIKKVAPQKPEAPQVAESTQKTVKAAPKQVEEKKPVEPPSVEPTLDGHYELSPLMTKMLEAELQDVMTKIWQSFPGNTPDRAEKVVKERFRNGAADELRNTLGLNITKRLLNVHNTLYVKLVFSESPLRVNIANFVKRYNICAFKRVGVQGSTFAAKMQNFQDFDDLCTHTTLRCGKAHVTVTPCYQFMTCPPNLKTCYDRNDHSKLNKHTENTAVTTKSLPNSGQEAKPVNDNIPTNKTKEINKNRPAIKTNTKNVEPDESQTTKLIEKDVFVQKTVNPKVTPAKSIQAANKVATKMPPSKANQTETVNKAAQKITPVKAKVPASQNKQAAAEISVAESSENVTLKQNQAPKVTAAKLNPAPTSAKPNTAVTGKQSLASAPAKPNPAATEKQSLASTPAKPNPAATEKQSPASIPAKANSAPIQKQSLASTPAKPNSAPTQKQSLASTPAKPKSAPTQKQSLASTTAKPNPAATEKQSPASTPAKPNSAPTQKQTLASTPAKPNSAPTQKQSLASAPAKPNPTATEKQSPATKATPAKQATINNQKVTPAKPAATNNKNPVPKVTPAKPAATSNQNLAAKTTPTKPATPNNQTVARKTDDKAVIGTKANVAPKVTPSKPAVDNKQKLALKPTKQIQISSKKTRASDFDELDDHDILAMLSGGIILDECSGSEED